MSELKKMTKLGGDVRKIAALLQAKAPKGEMLAYINPREAAILKSYGGSGEIDPETGIPSFDDGFDMGETIPYTSEQVADLYPQGDTTAGATFSPSGEATPYYGMNIPLRPETGGGLGLQRGAGQTGLALPSVDAIQTPSLPVSPAYDPASKLTAAPEAPTAEKPLMSKDTMARLGLAGVLGTLGAGTARRAQQAGQRGAQEMKALAQPYQVAGTEAQAKAQRGELLPVGQQSLEAVRAQIAQDIQRRGGVGAQQAAVQVENMRQQLLQQQYDYGLKLSGIGDNIALGAIRTGMQADQYVNQLTNNFYSNMAYIASGMSPGVRIGGTTQGAIA